MYDVFNNFTHVSSWQLPNNLSHIVNKKDPLDLNSTQKITLRIKTIKVTVCETLEGDAIILVRYEKYYLSS